MTLGRALRDDMDERSRSCCEPEIVEAPPSQHATRSDVKACESALRTEIKTIETALRSEIRSQVSEARGDLIKWLACVVGLQTVVLVGAIVALVCVVGS